MIEKRGDQWCLLTHDGSRVLGCHDSEAGAQEQERAVQASKHAHAQQIRGAEIFATGTWNGDTYTEADLDAIVEAFQSVGFQVPIKLGHSDTPGAPAVGWVESLRREGQALYGDLVALPDTIYQAIKDRGYDAVSAEIFWNLDRAGKKYPRVLKGLALLGAETPAVDLAPLHKFLSMTPLPESAFHTYATELKVDSHVYITRRLMEELCPTCAAEMQAKKINRLKIPRGSDGTYNFDGLKEYTGFSKGLCDRFGAADGFRTRCMAAMGDAEDKISDPAGFCNALKQWCGLMTDKSGEVHIVDEIHASPSTSVFTIMETKMAEEKPETKSDEIVVKVADLRMLQDRASESDRLRDREKAIEEREREYAETAEKHRQDQIRHALLGLKVPAFRVYMRALYEMALETPRVKTYQLNTDPKAPSVGAVAVVEALMTEMNRHAEGLFKAFSEHKPIEKPDPNEPETLQGKIDYRVRQFCRANKMDYVKDYRTALEAVLNSDPDLKLQYSKS